VKLDFIRPGKPIEKGMIESFNGRLRDECLNVNEFVMLDDVKTASRAWRHDCNHCRPHGSLGDLTPSEYGRKWSGHDESLEPPSLSRFGLQERELDRAWPLRRQLCATGTGQSGGSGQGAEFQDITTVDGHGSLRGRIACGQDVPLIPSDQSASSNSLVSGSH
jgi:hypothetical protein